MRVSELYGPVSQGEGALLGVPMPFIRLAGCNLSCSWCDSAYTWKPGYAYTEMSAEQVLDKALELCAAGVERGQGACQWVNITGGEPTIHPDLGELVRLLGQWRKRVIVETNGLRVCEWMAQPHVYVSCSPKLPGSGQDTPARRAKVRKLVAARWADDPGQQRTQYKFVIATPDDLAQLTEYCADVGILREGVEWPTVYVQPNGYVQPTEKYLAELAWLQEAAPRWARVTPQVHRLIHGPDAKTV